MKLFKCLLSLCLLAVLAFSCTNSSTDNNTSKGPAFSASKTEKKADNSGEKIYMQYCKLCHGADGKLGLNGSKDITESTMPEDERILLIRNGKNTMTPFEEVLSEQEIKSVAAYTMSLGKDENKQ